MDAADTASMSPQDEKPKASSLTSGEELATLAADPELLKQSYGAPGFAALAQDKFVLGCALMASLSGLVFGYDQGVVAIVLVTRQFEEVVPRIADGHSDSGLWKGLLTAMIEIGACLGALCAGFVADRYSRRGAIWFGASWFILGSTLQTAAQGYGLLLAGRLLGGIGIGTLSVVAPLYISELSPPHIRGILLALEEFSIVFGICFAFYLTYGTRHIQSEWSWRFPFLLQILPAVVLCIGTWYLPYSPRWLAAQGRNDEALTTLARIRRNRSEKDALVQAEFIDIVAEAELQREIREERHPGKGALGLEIASWMDCFRPGCIRRTGVAAGLMLLQQANGINAVIYYSPTLFKLLGLNYDTSLLLSGAANLCQLAGVVLSFFIIDRFGRRPLLAWGSLSLTATMITIAILTALYSDAWRAHEAAAWSAVSMLLLYCFCFGVSWGPVPWAMPAELFSQSTRAKGVAIAVLSNWSNNAWVGFGTPPLIQRTDFGTFLFFGGFCFISFIWVLWCVPEVKGVPLEQLDAIFGDNSGEEDLKRINRIRKRLLEQHAAGAPLSAAQ